MKIVFDDKYKYSFAGAFIFSMLANGYAFFNFFPGHDAINHALYLAGAWEVQLGRFLQPIYGEIRGMVTMPWLTGIISIIYFTVIGKLVADLLEIDIPIMIFLGTGIMVANVIVAELCAGFMYMYDAYVLAVLFACLGVWCVEKYLSGYGILLGALCFVFSMGLYQALICVSLVLISFLICKNAINDCDIKQTFKLGIRHGISLIVGGILYFVMAKAVLFIYGVQPADGKNSIFTLENKSVRDILDRTFSSVKNIRNFYFFGMNEISNWIAFCNLCLLLFTCFMVLILIKKNRIYNWLLLGGVIILLIPFMNLIPIIEGESFTFMTSFQMVMLFPGIIGIYCLFERRIKLQERFQALIINLKKVIIILFLIIIFQNAVYSNGEYIIHDILHSRAQSTGTRILVELEKYPGYETGVTEVAFIGDIRYNKLIFDGIPEGYNELRGHSLTGFTYTATLVNILQNVGAVPIKTVDSETLNELKNNEIVKAMPCFPEQGYMEGIDDIIVIKIADE